MWYLKLIIVIVFALVVYQDCKDRLVYWFLYPLIGVLAFTIQLYYLPIELVLLNSGSNLLFTALLLGVSFVYVKLRNLNFQSAIGLGDVLFFIFISFAFGTISFIVLFVFALLFSLILHFVLQHRRDLITVPLAGYMSVFFGAVYVFSFFDNSNFLYAY